MSDTESRKAFEAWFNSQGWAHEAYAKSVALQAWSARDAEVSALKARIAELEHENRLLKEGGGARSSDE